METLYLILAAAVFVVLGLRYCYKSIELDNIKPDMYLSAPKPKLKVIVDDVSLVKYDVKPLTKKDFLLAFLLKFKKSNPYDKNLVLSSKAMYNLYLQLHEEVHFPLKPYDYPNFCKAIRGKNLNLITVKNGNKTTLELRGYYYQDLYKE